MTFYVTATFCSDFSYFCFFFGFSGNHPFFTRSSCSNNSLMLQMQVIPKTAISTLMIIFEIRREASSEKIPIPANTGQTCFPKYYSVLMTIK